MSAEEETKKPSAEAPHPAPLPEGERDTKGSPSDGAAKGTSGGAKRARIGLNVGLMSALALVLFLIANYLSFRWYDRWDWTSDELYTLSQRSKQVLGRINKRIDVYVFVSRGDTMFADLKELFTRYGAETHRLKVEFVDPDLNPTRFQLLSQRLGVRSGQTPQGQTITDVAIAVSSGERRWFITRDDLQDVEIGGEEGAPRPEMTGFKAEQALTSAIVHVQSSRVTKICFTKGHGEWAVSGFGERGLGHVREDLRPDNYETEEIETRGRSEIPRGCDAVAVIGPQRPFDEAEAGSLRAYVTGGGNLLLALDPVLDRASQGRSRMMPSGLESLARELGVRVDDALVLEADEGHRLDPNLVEVFVATNYGQHPLVSGFGEAPLAFVSTRAVRPADGSSATAVVTTTDEAWAETDIAGLVEGRNPERGDTDVRGPVPLVVATEAPAPSGNARRGQNAARPRGGRVVVIGDADFLNTDFFRQPLVVNRDFTLATFAWLTQREELVAIGAKPARSGSLNLTEGDLSKLFLYVVVLMPFAALVLGGATWLSRRS
ncbi:MAG: Gldg family protein [Deltaproteobacteria bacterium]|nr:Gldg family protein [Deltaproteobacteria bacterium]